MKKLLSLFLLSASAMTFASPSTDDCLLNAIKTATPDTSVQELYQLCQSQIKVDNTIPAEQIVAASDEESSLERRRRIERSTRDKQFVITPHRINYLLPLSYNSSPNATPYAINNGKMDNVEVKFQLSLKVPLVYDLFGDNGDLYMAYTNQSWWQAYNKNISSPFRETNHEPEIFLDFSSDRELFGMSLRNTRLGLNHQSNGRTGSLSRSWNRVYASFLFEKGDFYTTIKPWWRIPEKKKSSPNASSGDDNPDIQKYLGHGELGMFYRMGNHNLSMMLRNNLRSDNKGAVQLDWTFPLSGRFRGYVQYFNGYGESLIDYNASVNRLSLGVILTDRL